VPGVPGCRGARASPKSFDLSKSWAKSLKIWAKSLNPGKNGAQRLLKKHMGRPFFGIHTKKGIRDLCGRKFVGKVAQKFFRQFGKIRAKILRTPKNLPTATSMTQSAVIENVMKFVLTARRASQAHIR